MMNEYVLVGYVARELVLDLLPSNVIPIIALDYSVEPLGLNIDLAGQSYFP